MKVIPLYGKMKTYSCRSYLVLGDWNRIEDRNTLVDTGTDGSIVEEIELISTGIGKNPVEQIMLTHSHFDHTGGIAALKKRFKSRVYAFHENDDVDELVRNGQYIKMGDRFFEVIHTPGHSHDSICLYCSEQKVLFSGDTMVRIMSPGGSYTPEFVAALEKLASLDIEVIYGGHDEPMTDHIRETILATVSNVRKSRITVTDSESGLAT